jgi:hypothetical protein
MTEAQAAAAEPVVWDALKADLWNRGQADQALTLQHQRRALLDRVVDEGPYRRVRFILWDRLSDYSAQYNTVTGEPLSWLFGALLRGSSDEMDKEEGLALAQEAAQPPPEAVLEQADYQVQGGQPVFVVRWAHHHDGIPVERDYIQALVNGATRRVVAVHRKWHEVDPAPSAR